MIATLSCGEDATAPPPPPPGPVGPTSLSVSPADLRFEALGDTARFAAEVRDQNGEVVGGVALTWDSRDPSVATVDATGLATAVGNGTASVTARAGEASGSATVTVEQVVSSLDLSPPSITLALDDTLRLVVEAADANGHSVTDPNIAWRSSDASIANVDATGLIRGTGVGTTMVTATGGVTSADADVRVLDGADADRLVLEELYDVTLGEDWINDDNWLTDEPLGRWRGVSVDEDGRVVKLDLEANNLVGTIPSQLSRLTRLRELTLIRNALRGAIPPELGGLGQLEVLGLAINRLTGPLPPELATLANLKELLVYRNSLTGSIPWQFSDLGRLEKLVVYWNLLSGPIPQGFLHLDRLEEFDASLTSICVPGTAAFSRWLEDLPIPDFEGFCNQSDVTTLEGLYRTTGGENWNESGGWGANVVLATWHGVRADSLGRVVALDLSANGLAGPIPGSLGQLSGLTELRIGDNDLTGPLPLSLARLPLREFRYASTELCVPDDASFRDWLTGIPSRDGTDLRCAITDRNILETLYHGTDGPNWARKSNWLTDEPLHAWYGVEADANGAVVGLELRNNRLRGEIPEELAWLLELEVLELGRNQLVGPVPPVAGNLGNLRVLSLDRNQLEGAIPPELGNLGNLRVLSLDRNQLEGAIPPELGNLAELQSLSIGSNRLMGPVPTELAGLTELADLNLPANRLTGTIPPALGDLPALRSLQLSDNGLTGVIPPELGRLANLQGLRLSNNELTGAIPPELGDLSSLKVLTLDRNRLSGAIPAELGNLAELQFLSVTHNELAGPIPSELGDLRNLGGLHLGSNALTGPIPPELGNLGSISELALSANRLSGPLPAGLAALTRLRGLELNDNPALAGPLPRELTALGQLLAFQAGGTDLCAPLDADFGAWLERIPTRRVARCLPGGGVESAAYLVQAIQSRSHPVPLIADDPALLRVFVASPSAGGATLPAIRASFYHGGAEVHRVHVDAGTAVIPTSLDESAFERSSNAEIPGWVVQPGLEMVVEIDPEGTLDPTSEIQKRIPREGRASLEVIAPPPLELTLIPMLWSVAPDSSILDITEGLTVDDELLAPVGSLLPVGQFNLHVHDPVVTSSRSTFDLLGEAWLTRQMEGGTGYYMGTMTEPSVSVGIAQIGGPASFAAPDRHAIVHELGHNMSLYHAPCGGAGGPDPAFPYADGASGAWGYDFESHMLIPPGVPDLMGYCTPYWISDYSFMNAAQFRRFYEPAGIGASGVPTRTLILWGGVQPDGLPFLEPAFVVDAPVALPQSAGAYELTGVASDGRVLFSESLDMPELADGEGGSRFMLALPVEPAWGASLAKVTLSGPGGTARLDAETDAPMAIVRNRLSGQVRGILRGPITDSLANAAALVADPDVEVLFSRGLPGRDGWRR
ncbi:leucine-rich repeat domain-containing protein [Candidatus Palauibacter sp.]|uniref:leucine-rich repeat domain-containing protein n=1 Tax=Candidatus Palauibacter sp. TaxID=3101350 RepID=UPI003B02DC8D